MTGPDAFLSAEEHSPSLSEFLAHAYIGRRTALAMFGGVFGFALILAALLPAQYRATASLAIMPSPEYTVREDAGSPAFSTTALAMDQIMKAETEILSSDDLHEGTIAALGAVAGGRGGVQDGVGLLYPDLAPGHAGNGLVHGLVSALKFLLTPWRSAATPAASPMDRALRRFNDHLRVLPAKDSNVIAVTFVHDDAAIAACVLNGLLARYAERRQKLYNDPQLAVAIRQMEATAAAVRQADMALLAFNAAHDYSDYAVERDLLLKRRSMAAQGLADATSAQVQAQARLQTLIGEIHGLPASSSLFQERDTDVRMQAIDASLVDLRGRLAAARDHYRDTSRIVTGLRQEISAREADRLDIARNPTPSVLRTGRSQALDPLLVDRAHAAADQTAARAQAGAMQREIERLGGQLRRLDADAAALADLTRQKAAAADSYAATSRIVADLKLSEAEEVRRLANVRVVQPARIPDQTTGTKMLICLCGLTLGMAVAFAWLVFRFAARPTFLTPYGLTAATGLPVLGVFERADAGFR